MSLRWSQAALWSVLVVLGYQLVHASGALPERVASHFDLSGTADGWSSRRQLLVVIGSMVALVAGLGFGLPRLVAVLPVSLINLPHREYWLAPERRARTVDRIADDLAWFAVLTGVLMILVFQGTIAYNLDPESGAMANTIWIVAAYVLATFAWAARLCLRFRLPADARGESSS